MDIILSFGKQYIETTEGSFWISLVTAFLGAFFGFLLALLANNILEKKNTKKKEKEIIQRKLNQLLYLESIIESIIKIIPNQASKFKTAAEVIKKNPLEITTPEIIASFDLLRLRNSDNNETQAAFFHFFKDDENCFDKYKTLFAHCDYLFRTFETIEKTIERAITFAHKDQLAVRDLVEEMSTLLALRIDTLNKSLPDSRKNTDEEFLFLKKIETVYLTIFKKMAVFEEVKVLYVMPILNNSLNLIQDKEISNRVFLLCMQAKSRIINIEGNSNIFADDLAQFENETVKNLNYLKQVKSDIDKIKNKR